MTPRDWRHGYARIDTCIRTVAGTKHACRWLVEHASAVVNSDGEITNIVQMPAPSSSTTLLPRTLATSGLPRRVRAVLEQALALVSADLDPNLGAMLKEFEQELFRLADTSRNSGSQADYMQALRTLRLNRADLIPRFMLEIESGLAALRCKAAESAALPAAQVSFRNLSLVEDTVMDEDTVLGEIASRQEGRAALPLHLLGQRFGVLAGAPAFDAEHSPLGPRALCRAMRSAAKTLQVSYDARLLLYRIFDRQVMASYARTLDALDATVATAGVLPGLTFMPLRLRATAQDSGPDDEAADDDDSVQGRAVPSASSRARQATGSGASAAGNARSTRDGTQSAALSANAARSAAQADGSAGSAAPSPGNATPGGGTPAKQLPARNDSQRPFTGWLGDIDTDSVSSSGADGQASALDEEGSLAVLQQLITGRRELIGKLRPSRDTDSKPRDQLSTQDVFAALGDIQSQAPAQGSAASNLQDIKQTVLAQLRQQRGRGAALSQKDNDTFELLSMLYSQIESEIRPDAPATALIRRLQMPLLRVALQDRAFFVRGRHPARLLLNVVAESAAKWLGEDDFDPQLLAPLQEAVTHVVENYNGDDSVFDASNTQLERHLHAQVRKAEMLEKRHVEAARGKEKLAVAKLRASDTLTALVGHHRLGKFVRALLNQAWTDVLTLTLLRQGEHSEEWRQQVRSTQQIIAACSHGGSPADPALQAHIEAALTQVGYHADEAEVIAKRLTSSDSDDKDDAASRTELTVKLKARTRLGEDAAQANKPKLQPRLPDEQLRYEQVRVLPFGTWIEFVTNQQGDVVRRRLSWFSPVTDNALFVNQRGQRVGEQSVDSLARMLAGGQARIVTAERARLVDRAWQAAVSALRSFAGRNDEPAVVDPPP